MENQVDNRNELKIISIGALDEFALNTGMKTLMKNRSIFCLFYPQTNNGTTP
jgi:hypothetical protein